MLNLNQIQSDDQVYQRRGGGWSVVVICSNLNLDLNWWSGASKERGRVVGGRDLLTEDSVPTSHWPAASLTIRNWKQIQSEKIKKSMITAENKWCRKSFPWGESLAGVDRPTQKNCIWIFICCPRQIQKTKQGNLLAGRRVVVRKVPSGACWWEEVGAPTSSHFPISSSHWGQPDEKLEAKHNCLIRLTKPPLESRRPCISFIVQVLHFDLTLCHTCTLFSTTVYNLNHIYVF